jgi:hypothetical protein
VLKLAEKIIFISIQRRNRGVLENDDVMWEKNRRVA